jgi:hypothetical protein
MSFRESLTIACAARRDDYLNDLSDWLDIDLWSAGELAGRPAMTREAR